MSGLAPRLTDPPHFTQIPPSPPLPLGRRFSGSKRTANAVHPGVVRTNLDRNNLVGRILYRIVGPILVKNVAAGAATQMFVATHPAVAAESGKYFADCMITPSRPDTDDPALAKRLWEVSALIAQDVPASSAGFPGQLLKAKS